MNTVNLAQKKLSKFIEKINLIDSFIYSFKKESSKTKWEIC